MCTWKRYNILFNQTEQTSYRTSVGRMENSSSQSSSLFAPRSTATNGMEEESKKNNSVSDSSTTTSLSTTASGAIQSLTTPTPTNNPTNTVIESFGLGLYWDEWARCVGSRYQMDHLYRVGKLDSCSRQWKDLKVAFRAKMKGGYDPHGAKELLDSTYYRKRISISPTAGAIWELKDKPGWN